MITNHHTNHQRHPAAVFLGLSSFEMLAMFRRGLFYAYLSIYLRHFLGMSVTETTLFATLPMVATVLYALSNNLALIFGLSALRGFSEVIILAASYALASILIPPVKRAHYFGLFNATYFLSWGVAGTLIVGPLTNVLISRGAAEVLAYRMAFVSASILTLLGVIILAGLLWNMRSKADNTDHSPA